VYLQNTNKRILRKDHSHGQGEHGAMIKVEDVLGNTCLFYGDSHAMFTKKFGVAELVNSVKWQNDQL